MHPDHQDRPKADRPSSFDHTGPGALDDDQALQVVLHLARELPEVTDQQAIVAVARLEDGTTGLLDVTLHADGILEAPDDASGIAVVTSDSVDAADNGASAQTSEAAGEADPAGAKVRRQQLVVIRRDGSEIGADRLAGSTQLSTWRVEHTDSGSTDVEAVASAPSPSPTDVAANTARRAFGVPSQLPRTLNARAMGARIWLARVADVALQAFDTNDGPRDVAPSQLKAADTPVIAAGDACTWPQLRAAAADGTLELGPHTVAPTYAAWLDDAGFAQLLDEVLPSPTALIGTLEVTGGEQLVSWATGALSTRGLRL